LSHIRLLIEIQVEAVTEIVRESVTGNRILRPIETDIQLI